jgi:4-hydroxy-3-methylbut-2-enyl diphosphate reductase IspH
VVKRVLIASHRGYCAGVERAVETVERALEIYGPPVYVRKQIVHNTHVVGDLQARGAIFVESEAAVLGAEGSFSPRTASRPRSIALLPPAASRR